MAKTEEEKAAEKAAKERAKLVDALAKLGVEVGAEDARTNDELAALLEEKKQAAKDAADNGEIVIRFRDHRGNPTERTYSKADHGPEYKELAEQFKTKHASRLIGK